jgi:hypothetical protein
MVAARQTLTQYEGPGEVQFDAKSLAEAISVSVSIAPNSQPVRTMKKGLSGRSRGPVECTIRVSNAVPKAGMEIDFLEKCINDADVTINIVVGGKRLGFDGWITGFDAEYSVGSPAGATFTVMAGKPRRL